MEFHLAKTEDSQKFFEHLDRLINSSGQGGVIFSPRENGEFKPSEEGRIQVEKRWLKPVGEAGWERAWLCEKEQNIVGHILLRGMNIKSSLHRVELQMGIEVLFRGQKIGKELLDIAVAWARTNSFLEWIDLGVFDRNRAAIKLYARTSFEAG